MMSPVVIVSVQFTLGFIFYLTIFRQYAVGPLRRSTAIAAIAPLLLLHGVRLLGLTLLAPGQADPAQNMDALRTIAFGDLSAAVTGIVAALAAYRGSSWTAQLAWLFTVVGLGDLAVVGFTVASAGILDLGIGSMWLTFGLLAPALVISHVYILSILIKRRSELATPAA